MNIIITTDSKKKLELQEKIDQLQETIQMYLDIGDTNLANLYIERQNTLIAELFDLDV